MTENLSVERNESNQRKLKRVGEKKFKSFEAAKTWQENVKAAKHEVQPAKVKIFARYDGTYDVVTYVNIQTAKTAEAASEVKVEKKTKKKAQ